MDYSLLLVVETLRESSENSLFNSKLDKPEVVEIDMPETQNKFTESLLRNKYISIQGSLGTEYVKSRLDSDPLAITVNEIPIIK